MSTASSCSSVKRSSLGGMTGAPGRVRHSGYPTAHATNAPTICPTMTSLPVNNSDRRSREDRINQ
eukprot:4440905-Prymnesium_polylepis.1